MSSHILTLTKNRVVFALANLVPLGATLLIIAKQTGQMKYCSKMILQYSSVHYSCSPAKIFRLR